MNSIRVLLFVAANLDWPLHKVDVKNAFLNGDLEKEVYMEVSPTLEDLSSMGKYANWKRLCMV
jgi:hypothetical protein